MVNQSGGQLACEYGSSGRDKEQSLVEPMSLFRVDEDHFIVVDYGQHRLHLLTTDMQFVRHLISDPTTTNPSIANPRHVCLDDNGHLYVGTERGTVGVYRVRN